MAAMELMKEEAAIILDKLHSHIIYG